MDKPAQKISSAFPYEPNYVNVYGSKMHYVEEGKGDPIVFLHGIPTSSYLWRNIIPRLMSNARCIAVDLIGMGKSDKPDIDYHLFDHIRYIEGFISALELTNITFVMHGWGSVIGFDYAMRHQDNIKGLAFLESHVRPVTGWEMVALPVQELTKVLNMPDGGYDMIMNSNYFIDKVLPNSVLRKLSDEEMAYYLEPFAKSGSRKPLWQYLQDLPLGQGPQEVVKLISCYSEKLCKSTIPKLMLYAVPGFITTIATVQWARESLPNLTLVDIGDALHYAQEVKPETIGKEVQNWYLKNLCPLIGKKDMN